MKLLNLNASAFDNNQAEVAEFVLSEKFDFVCFQETNRNLDKFVEEQFKSNDFFRHKFSKILPYSFFAPNFTSDHFQKGDIFTKHFGGFVEMGNTTFSKIEIKNADQIFVLRNFEYMTDFSNWTEHDVPRSINRTVYEMDGKLLQIINYHGIWTRDKQGDNRCIEASKQIVGIIKTTVIPTVLCGDFNLFPETESIRVLDQVLLNLCNQFSIKTTRPETNELSGKARNVVDYIFVSEEIDVQNFEVVKTNISDHLPLVLDFKIKE